MTGDRYSEVVVSTGLTVVFFAENFNSTVSCKIEQSTSFHGNIIYPITLSLDLTY